MTAVLVTPVEVPLDPLEVAALLGAVESVLGAMRASDGSLGASLTRHGLESVEAMLTRLQAYRARNPRWVTHPTFTPVTAYIAFEACAHWLQVSEPSDMEALDLADMPREVLDLACATIRAVQEKLATVRDLEPQLRGETYRPVAAHHA